MTIINIDTLISKLQSAKAQISGNALVALAADDALGSDRYGVGFGLIVGEASAIETLRDTHVKHNLAFKKEDFAKVEVLARDYCETGCLY